MTIRPKGRSSVCKIPVLAPSGIMHEPGMFFLHREEVEADGYSGSRIAIPRGHYGQVAFSLRKRQPSLPSNGYVNSGTALDSTIVVLSVEKVPL